MYMCMCITHHMRDRWRIYVICSTAALYMHPWPFWLWACMATWHVNCYDYRYRISWKVHIVLVGVGMLVILARSMLQGVPPTEGRETTFYINTPTRFWKLTDSLNVTAAHTYRWIISILPFFLHFQKRNPRPVFANYWVRATENTKYDQHF